MATLAMARPRVSRERIFFTGTAAAMLLAVIIGFGPVYYFLPVQPAPAGHIPATPLVHLHGGVFSAWMLLLMAQTSLVAAGRRDLHIKLGVVGLGLVLAMIAVGTLAALHQIERGTQPPGAPPPLSWLAVPLFGVAGFGPLFLLALKYKKRPAVHKRLMLIGTACMLGAAFGRMPFLPTLVGLWVMPNMFTLAIAAWDVKTTGRVQAATLWGGALAVVATVVPMFVWKSPAWLAFAGWAAGLVA